VAAPVATSRRDAGPHDAPLAGLRVLDLTRVLAGPVACRTLAVLGADVLTVHSPGLPNIAALPDTSRGKRSATIAVASDPEPLRALLGNADVFFQAARPGAIAALGFGPHNLHRIRPGIIAVDLDAWGERGPWGGKRGFDSLVQTATGLNDAERIALGRESPQPLPVQILDYATGFLAALGTQAALLRQRTQGGSWRVHVSLARTALWLRSLGRYRAEQRHEPGGANDGGFDRATGRTRDRPTDRASIAAALRPFPSDFGALRALPHAARFSRPWPAPSQPSRPPGSDPPAWW
jgi:crotonobetainyl-CoA:carnitine CoA-transferase CaiB-like acyl-CoA transferase